MALYSPVSGRSVWVGEVKDCQAELHEPNVLIWKDAFSGITADVRIRYETGSIEQDVILRQNIDPGDYGMDPVADGEPRLEVWSEFEAPTPVKGEIQLKKEPNPVRRAQMVEPDFTDEALDFCSAKLIMREKVFGMG